MKYLHVSLVAALPDDQDSKVLLDAIKALVPDGNIEVVSYEFQERSIEDRSKVVWLRDDCLDEPWERVKDGFDSTQGEILSEDASAFLCKVGIAKGICGTYPDTGEFGLPAWADPVEESDAEAKNIAAEYGFAVADQDYEVKGKCTHDDSGGVMWLQVYLTDEEYTQFEALQKAQAELVPTAEMAR